RLGLLLVMNVDGRAVPLGDATVTIAGWAPESSKPTIHTICAPQTLLGVIVITSLKAMSPSPGDALIVVRMNYVAPTELIPIPQGIEILLWGAEICQGVWADIGKPSTGIG